MTPFVDQSSERNTICTVTPVEQFTKTTSLLISQSISTITDKKVVVTVTNTTESLYTFKKNMQIAEFSAVTPAKSEFITALEAAIVGTIPEGDQDLIVYVLELLRTEKPEQQNNDFRFPTTKTLGKTGDHTAIQTRILEKRNELKDKEKSNPTDNAES